MGLQRYGRHFALTIGVVEIRADRPFRNRRRAKNMDRKMKGAQET